MVTKKALVVLNTIFEKDSTDPSGAPWLHEFEKCVLSQKLPAAFEQLRVPQADTTVYNNVSAADFTALFPVGSSTVASDAPLELVLFIYIFSHGSSDGVAMRGVNTFVGFEKIISLVQDAYPSQKTQIVLIFDCCTSGSSIETVFNNELTQRRQPLNMTIMCSTSTYNGPSIYLPAIGESAFCAAFCNVCMRISGMLAGLVINSFDVFYETLSRENASALKLRSEFFASTSAKVTNMASSLERTNLISIAAEGTPLHSFLAKQIELNSETAKFLQSAAYHMRTGRASGRSADPLVLWSVIATAQDLLMVIFEDETKYVNPHAQLSGDEFCKQHEAQAKKLDKEFSWMDYSRKKKSAP